MKGFEICIFPRADSGLGHAVLVTFAGGFNSKVACAISQILDRMVISRLSFATTEPGVSAVLDDHMVLDLDNGKHEHFPIYPDDSMVDQLLTILGQFFPHLNDPVENDPQPPYRTAFPHAETAEA